MARAISWAFFFLLVCQPRKTAAREHMIVASCQTARQVAAGEGRTKTWGRNVNAE